MRFWRLSATVALWVSLVSVLTLPGTSAPVASAAGAGAQVSKDAIADAVYKVLIGPWVGALEYSDYSNNKRVVLPTIVHIRRTKDANSLSLHYIYDDGPTKVVEDFETVMIDHVSSTYTTVSSDGKDTSTDKLVGLVDFAKAKRGKLLRLGKEKENDKLVDVRTTLTISPQTLTILKETRLAGQAFAFRHEYTLRRVGPAMTGQ